MIRSMTAFARVDGRTDDAELTWELRSVNHRYLEPFVRLPDELRALEPQVREQLNARLGRGKPRGREHDQQREGRAPHGRPCLEVLLTVFPPLLQRHAEATPETCHRKRREGVLGRQGSTPAGSGPALGGAFKVAGAVSGSGRAHGRRSEAGRDPRSACEGQRADRNHKAPFRVR